MSHPAPSTPHQHTALPPDRPAPVDLDPRQASVPQSGERNPAQTDDSPDAILGYN